MGIVRISPVPQVVDGYASKIFEAVAEACRLPAGKIRDDLIVELIGLIQVCRHPPMMVTNEDSGMTLGKK